jgi:hypothetical protein
MEKAFVDLKELFTTATILTHYSPERLCIVEPDASDFALGAVISHHSSDDKLYPIAYHSCRFSPAEIDYEIHDKELLVVVDFFKIWRKYIEGGLLPVLVYTDHQNLEYFTTTKVLTRRQARWAQELAGIDFKICYCSWVTKLQAGCSLTAFGVLPSERGISRATDSNRAPRITF